jgi:2-oxoglutarate ferredoxin oxidoreductase subunit gamma
MPGGVTEIRAAGFGGQGVILSALVMGKAYAVFEGGFATLTQSFGPEARGGACSAQVIISSGPVLYPYVTAPDILLVMSQEAFAKFVPSLKPGGILVIEEDLVRVSRLKPGTRLFSCPATRIAEKLGKSMVLNIVMVGFLAAVSQVLKPESLRQAIAASVPEHFKELNLKAFAEGYEAGRTRLEAAPHGEPWEGLQIDEAGVLEGV